MSATNLFIFMQKKEYYINSKDGCRLYYRCWEPEGAPVGVINLVHGFGEHSGRYNEWAQKFVQAGYAVTAVDYRGHGKADGKRGHASSMQRLLDDIETLLHLSRQQFPHAPHFLYGHSMGGNLVINYHLRRDRGELKALIVSSPWIKLAFEASVFKILLAKMLVHVFPSVVTETNLVVEHISHDPQVQEAYRADPLVHGFISLKLYDVITRGGNFILKNGHRIAIPTLLMHGTADMITSYKASLYLGYKGREKITFKSWPGLYHELHNEYEKEDVFRYIYEWLKKIS